LAIHSGGRGPALIWIRVFAFLAPATVRVLGRGVRAPARHVVALIVNVLVDEAGRPIAAVRDQGGFMGLASAGSPWGGAR
jgi:hypothetical protein